MKLNIKMKMIGVVMAILAVTPLMAQDLKMNGFAGKDDEVLFTPSPEHPSKEILLGSDDPATTNANCVFSWRVVEGPDGYTIMEPKSNRPTLKVTLGGDYYVEATRVSQYGYQTESVCITVKSDVTLVSATPKKDCWENGDKVEADNFTFVTSPPGYDYLVEVDDRDKLIGRYGNAYGDEEIRFKIKDPNYDVYTDCDVTAEIFVSMGDLFDLSISNEGLGKLPKNIPTLIKLKDVIMNAPSKIDRFIGVMDMVREFTPPSAPITPKFSKEFKVNCGVNMACCEMGDKVVPVGFLHMGGTFDLSVGIDIRQPLFPPIPGFGVDLVGSISAGVSASGSWQITTPEYSSCNKISIDFKANGGVEIGAEASAVDPDILSVKAVFYGQVEGSSKIEVFPKPSFKFGGINLSAGVKASGTVLGFNKELFNLSFGTLPLMEGED